MTTRRTVLVAMASMLLMTGCKRPAASPPPPPPPVPADLSRMVVIGASVSDGFGSLLPGREPRGLLPLGVKFADVLGAIAHEHAPPASHSSAMFFMDPEATAESQVRAAKAADPAAVIAIDYLFWHAYGAMPEARRAEVFERGLSRLESIGAPVIVVADIPDMAHAVGTMLFAAQVPKPATLGALNARLEEWAAARGNVVIVPLGRLVADAMGERPVTLGGREYEASRTLLTRDGLHATLAGEIAVALETLGCMKASGVLAGNTTWDEDPESITRRLEERFPDRP